MTAPIVRLRSAAQRALAGPTVEAADVIDDDPRLDQPVAEIVVDGRYVPRSVTVACDEHDVRIRESKPRDLGAGAELLTVLLVAV